MALLIETGVGVANAESYVSVADADTYFVKRNDVTWPTFDLADKEAALRESCRFLDTLYRWAGVRMTATQTLHWPRYVPWDKDGKFISTVTIPPEIIEAQCYLAKEWMTNRSLAPSSDRGPVTSERVGTLAVTYGPGAGTVTARPYLDVLLAELVVSKRLGGLTAEAVRG